MFRLSCDRSRDYIFGRSNVHLTVGWDDDPDWCSANCGKRYITATDKLGVSPIPDTTFNLIPVRDGVKIQVSACGSANVGKLFREGDPINPLCLLWNMEVYTDNMNQQLDIASLEDCAIACSRVTGCEYVTYEPGLSICHMKSEYKGRRSKKFHALRMSCLTDQTSLADVELDVKPECYLTNRDIAAYDMQAVEDVETIEECVKRCYLSRNFGCKSVSYKSTSKMCHLKIIMEPNFISKSGTSSLIMDCITDAFIKSRSCKEGTYVSSTGTLVKEADAAIFAQIDAGLLTYFREATTGLYFFFSNAPDDPAILRGSSGPTKMFEIV
ncbi:MAG: uncharacterized protein KVP18_004800 [Porospora cf. gigantea A]|nr:MAG: hypothetical protein KVP18_004800 [Porospora cf. gigantea A]